MESREKFSSRLGFILISTGCAIGLGNVWRFPHVVGQYGGAAFLLIYFLFLVIFGVPVMTMEFSVGRAGKRSIARAFDALEPKGSKWHWYGIVGTCGNCLLMMFYTTVTGWMVAYFLKFLKGDFTADQTTQQIRDQFGELTSDPLLSVGFMVLVTVAGFFICSFGLEKGIEKITKVMMLLLLGLIVLLAVRAVTLPGAAEGLRYYLVPDWGKVKELGINQVIFAALGQAFFTLSIGMGCMTVFGSYIGNDQRLAGESVTVAVLDTFIAFTAGLIVIPSCFAYGIEPDAGPSLIFQTLPNVFREMPGGRIWGSLFFLFMIFAAFSTVVTVFETILSCCRDLFGWNRKKACLINAVLLSVLALPCALGFNLLSGIQPLGAGSTILDLEDFIISNNILPLGSMIYVLFCCTRYGWGWSAFTREANTGKGLSFPTGKPMKIYATYILPVFVIYIWVQGILAML